MLWLTLDIAGSDYLDQIDFKSLLPVAKGNTKHKGISVEKSVYGAYMDLQRMIRTEQYKLIIYPKIKIVRLYDLKNDPKEMTDLARLSSYKKVMDDLFQQLLEKQKEVNDPLNIKNAYEEFMINN